jgi:hypothetical protein
MKKLSVIKSRGGKPRAPVKIWGVLVFALMSVMLCPGIAAARNINWIRLGERTMTRVASRSLFQSPPTFLSSEL